MPEVPEPEIEQAESATSPHDHIHATPFDGSLHEHLAQDHGLDASDSLSPTTQQGLHDRVHGEAHAAD